MNTQMMKAQMITAFLQRYVQVNPEEVEAHMVDGFENDYIFIYSGLCVRIGDEGYDYQEDGSDLWLPLESVSQLRALLARE